MPTLASIDLCGPACICVYCVCTEKGRGSDERGEGTRGYTRGKGGKREESLGFCAVCSRPRSLALCVNRARGAYGDFVIGSRVEKNIFDFPLSAIAGVVIRKS